MIKIEKKSIKNKGFYYLSEQVNIGGKFKKIQVYLGKNIPNKLDEFLEKLKEKETCLLNDHISDLYKKERNIDLSIYRDIEKIRIQFKYYFFKLSSQKKELFWRDFAIKFIFESNSIEGSRLSESEIENIVKNNYVKKTINRKEILEVENSIRAFDFIRKGNFKLNQNNIKDLHKIVVDNLGVELGYKTKDIIVNNKKTCPPERVKQEMTKLIEWWNNQQKTKENSFLNAIKFHQKLELIHPFSDGNGRVGRLILIWMLQKNDYGVILFKNKNRYKYFSALSSSDNGRNNKLYRYVVEVYKKTFLEIA